MLRIKKDGDDCIAELLEKATVIGEDGSLTEGDWEILESVKLKKVAVSSSDGTGNTEAMEDGCVIEIQCSKSNGSYTRAEFIKSDGVKVNINRINVTKGDRRKVIKLVIPTGRHYID